MLSLVVSLFLALAITGYSQSSTCVWKGTSFQEPSVLETCGCRIGAIKPKPWSAFNVAAVPTRIGSRACTEAFPGEQLENAWSCMLIDADIISQTAVCVMQTEANQSISCTESCAVYKLRFTIDNWVSYCPVAMKAGLCMPSSCNSRHVLMDHAGCVKLETTEGPPLYVIRSFKLQVFDIGAALAAGIIVQRTLSRHLLAEGDTMHNHALCRVLVTFLWITFSAPMFLFQLFLYHVFIVLCFIPCGLFASSRAWLSARYHDGLETTLRPVSAWVLCRTVLSKRLFFNKQVRSRDALQSEHINAVPADLRSRLWLLLRTGLYLGAALQGATLSIDARAWRSDRSVGIIQNIFSWSAFIIEPFQRFSTTAAVPISVLILQILATALLWGYLLLLFSYSIISRFRELRKLERALQHADLVLMSAVYVVNFMALEVNVMSEASTSVWFFHMCLLFVLSFRAFLPLERPTTEIETLYISSASRDAQFLLALLNGFCSAWVNVVDEGNPLVGVCHWAAVTVPVLVACCRFSHIFQTHVWWVDACWLFFSCISMVSAIGSLAVKLSPVSVLVLEYVVVSSWLAVTTAFGIWVHRTRWRRSINIKAFDSV